MMVSPVIVLSCKTYVSHLIYKILQQVGKTYVMEEDSHMIITHTLHNALRE